MIKKLLSNQALCQLASYMVVGACATVVEWVFFYLLSQWLGVHYLWATALAFIISTAANWLFGRLMTFRNAEKQPIWLELAKIYAVSVVGLGLNLLLMYLFVQQAHLHEMVSKVLATIIVFAWNFATRKWLIYRRGKG